MQPQEERPDVESPASDGVDDTAHETEREAEKPREIGGPKGLEPTRYGDWERKGRCIDF